MGTDGRADAYSVVDQFEVAICAFAGSKFAVAVESCSAALFLCCKYLRVDEVTLPSRTYPSVPCQIIHAGGKVRFENSEWQGEYTLKPYPVVDSAVAFFRGMYQPGTYRCLSFHHKKVIPVGRGGMILTDDDAAADWFRLARHSGRHHHVPLQDDTLAMVGWDMFLTPEQAARGLLLLQSLRENEIVCGSFKDYPDLSGYRMFTEANR